MIEKIVIFFLLFVELSAQEATIHTSTPSLYIDQEVTCRVDVPIPEGSTLQPLSPQEMLPTVAIKDSQYNVKDHVLHMSYTLEPKKTGRCIFAPGFLTLSPSGKTILLPAASIECKASGLSSLLIAQALPLYPEKKVTMSTENRITFFNSERLARVQKDNLAAYKAYEGAWNLLAASIIIVAMSMLFVWALVQYELIRRGKEWLKPQEHPLKKLFQELHDPNATLQERWHRLERFIRIASLAHEDIEALFPLLHRAEAISYGLSPTTEEEWQQALQSLKRMYTIRLQN